MKVCKCASRSGAYLYKCVLTIVHVRTFVPPRGVVRVRSRECVGVNVGVCFGVTNHKVVDSRN